MILSEESLSCALGDGQDTLPDGSHCTLLACGIAVFRVFKQYPYGAPSIYQALSWGLRTLNGKASQGAQCNLTHLGGG